MPHTVVWKPNRIEIERFLYTPAGPVVRQAGQWGRQIQRVARRRVDTDSGQLVRSIHVVVNSRPGFVYADIGSDLKHAIWHHEGTGIYGHRGRPIRPTRASVMRFKPGKTPRPQTHGYRPAAQDNRQFVYARSVKGQPPNPYLTSALRDVVGGFARIRTFRR